MRLSEGNPFKTSENPQATLKKGTNFEYDGNFARAAHPVPSTSEARKNLQREQKQKPAKPNCQKVKAARKVPPSAQTALTHLENPNLEG